MNKQRKHLVFLGFLIVHKRYKILLSSLHSLSQVFSSLKHSRLIHLRKIKQGPQGQQNDIVESVSCCPLAFDKFGGRHFLVQFCPQISHRNSEELMNSVSVSKGDHVPGECFPLNSVDFYILLTEILSFLARINSPPFLLLLLLLWEQISKIDSSADYRKEWKISYGGE